MAGDREVALGMVPPLATSTALAASASRSSPLTSASRGSSLRSAVDVGGPRQWWRQTWRGAFPATLAHLPVVGLDPGCHAVGVVQDGLGEQGAVERPVSGEPELAEEHMLSSACAKAETGNLEELLQVLLGGPVCAFGLQVA